MTTHLKLTLQPQNLSFERVAFYKDGKVVQETTFADGSRD